MVNSNSSTNNGKKPARRTAEAQEEQGYAPDLLQVLANKQVEEERKLAGAIFLEDGKRARQVLADEGITWSMLHGIETKAFLQCVLDGMDPQLAANEIGAAETILSYSYPAISAIYAPQYARNVAEFYRQRAVLRITQEIGTAAADGNSTRLSEGITALSVLASTGDKKIHAALLEAGADHNGHAESLLLLHPNQFLWVRAWGWMYWTGTHWSLKQGEERVKAAVNATLKQRRIAASAADIPRLDLFRASLSNSQQINGTLDLLEPKVSTLPDEFDRDPDLLNCANGVLNLRTGILTPHDQSQRFSYVLPVRYDPNADQRLWIENVRGWAINQETADYCKIAMGYSITGLTAQECLFYLYGPKRAGKGTFIETITAMLGYPLAVEVDMNTFTSARDRESQNFDLAPLKPARFVAASESTENSALNAAKIKAMTGGNDIWCAFKHRDFFGYRPAFKIWLSSNYKVNVDAYDDAAWSRVKVIEFPRSHLGHEDIALKARLRRPENLEGVLAWAVEGAMEWYRLYDTGAGMPTPASVDAASRKHRAELDYVGQFLEEKYLQSEGAMERYSDVYQNYSEWCEENGVEPKKKRRFTEALRDLGYKTEKTTVNTVNGFYVFGLKRN